MTKFDAAALARRDTFTRELGIEVVEAGLGRAVTRVQVEERHVNFNGVCHGGLTFTLADAAFGYACNSHGVMSAGIDVHMMYNTAARVGDMLTATPWRSRAPPGSPTTASTSCAPTARYRRHVGDGLHHRPAGGGLGPWPSRAATPSPSSGATAIPPASSTIPPTSDGSTRRPIDCSWRPA